MSTFWAIVVVLGVAPVEGSTAPAVPSLPAIEHDKPIVPLREGVELRDAARAALARWARPGNQEAELAAREFLLLYRELQADDELARSQRKPLRGTVRGRLVALSRQLQKRAAVERRLAKKQQPKSVEAAVKEHAALAQWGGFGGGFGQQGIGGPGIGGGMMGGGPGSANDDYGEDLIELIQQTIAPRTWDVNGGPGSIYYWRPGRAMVVRQTAEVHEQISDVLQQMGKLGK
ncbi:MAG: hypothetical protein JXB62_14965 [Pirellulales bacterium]|nr:hypothetical protein [Pirellulales bacterium]